MGKVLGFLEGYLKPSTTNYSRLILWEGKLWVVCCGKPDGRLILIQYGGTTVTTALRTQRKSLYQRGPKSTPTYNFLNLLVRLSDKHLLGTHRLHCSWLYTEIGKVFRIYKKGVYFFKICYKCCEQYQVMKRSLDLDTRNISVRIKLDHHRGVRLFRPASGTKLI